VLTFINKLDQPSKDPFELMDEIERVLGVAAAPMNWPLGDGVDFRGVYDLETHALMLYERQKGGTRNAPSRSPTRRSTRRRDGRRTPQRELIEAVEIISGAGTRYDEAAYRAERQTPVFFGSALNDFGVEPFLNALLALAPSPRPRLSETRTSSSPRIRISPGSSSRFRRT
jgi:peptide chain release factor 3